MKSQTHANVINYFNRQISTAPFWNVHTYRFCGNKYVNMTMSAVRHWKPQWLD